MKKIIVQKLLAAAFILNLAGHGQAQTAATATVSTVPPPRGYMVISYDIKDQAAFQKYMDAAGSLATKYNGKVTIFNMKVKGTEGHPRSVFGMVEFLSLIDAQRFYESPEYSAARQFRMEATKGTSTVILTEGLPQ
jgi:uncharacterized protein (DUF1330 family)